MIEAAFFFGRKKAAFFVVVCGTQTGMLGIDMICGTQTRTYNNIKSWGNRSGSKPKQSNTIPVDLGAIKKRDIVPF